MPARTAQEGAGAVRGHCDHCGTWSGVILSGSTALDLLVAAVANAPAVAPAGVAALNAGFGHRTGYEWLSRDPAEVDADVADPWCGWDVPPDVIPALFAPAPRLADPAQLARIRSDLPILIASGDADPLAAGGVLLEQLGQRYRYAGVADVTIKLYLAARELVDIGLIDKILRHCVKALAIYQ